MEQLDHLWTLALAAREEAPELSRRYCLGLLRLCQDSDIVLDPLLLGQVCVGCGTIWRPSIDCQARCWTWRHVGQLRRSQKEPLIYTSKLFWTRRPHGKRKITHVMVYHCKCCNRRTVADHDPVLGTEAKAVAKITKAVANKAKLANMLQKKSPNGLPHANTLSDFLLRQG